ncbi:hypothetical protein [Campylobacter vulpis]|uniref:hypothetical protein n=1 Tax=Campylobacter vulpis TaxID=1655500 RepID=UPI001BCD30EA|nr:hypothetical protein [Campylobacter vulpis]MBS4234855.1 hypothetical protein [Campylobacter vulpis]MBS4268373.1 hypothetical protein [Campylobacter vulpis]MBS4329995.1 hypothetical protein [Campylobacter vulpis]
MAKILIFILVILCLALISFALRKKLGKKTKPFFIALLVIFIIFAVIFENKNLKLSDKKQDLLYAFHQGKVLKCKDFNVSKEHFNYEFGTSSFVAKNKEFKGVVLDIRKCELDDE